MQISCYLVLAIPNLAKRQNTVKGKSNARSKAKKKKSNGVNYLAKAWEFVRSPEGRKVGALLLILVSAFMVIAFISHFFTGYKDQSMLEAGGEKPHNWLGSVGAWVSQLFVNRGFGIMAILIPIYTGLLGFALLENNYYGFLKKMLRYVIFGVLWGAIFFSFLSIVLWKAPGLIGGGFGAYVNESMFFLIGKVGMGLLVAIGLLIFLVINFNLEFPVSKWVEKKPGEEIDAETAAESETKAEAAEETTSEETATEETAESEAKKEDDFVVSVRPAEEEEAASEAVEDPAKSEEAPDHSNAENTEAKTEETPETAGVELELTTTPGPETENVSSTGPELEVSLPTPDEIPELGTSSVNPDGGLELAIEENTGDAELKSEEITGINGDNIVETAESEYEKIVPEKDQESLEADEDVGDWEDYDPTLELSTYQYPPIDLLIARDSANSRAVNRAELEENKNKIVTTLQNYKIDIVSIKATIGPTVTLYEIVPAPGVRISKIRNLEDDIALSLAALGIRIIAPIPGKGTIGIEIPNSNPEIVSMRSVMATEKFRDTKKELPLVLGRTISNEVFIADLAKMPHLLIAGATGQGKSVGINGIISSILFKKHPSQVKFVLIDPKKVELSLYSSLLKHFLAKLEGYDDAIITDTKQVIHVLNSLCVEMDQRYDLLKKAKVRNLREYNEKFVARRLNPRKGHRFMPYIVLVIDEFADLMMTAGKEIETPIARLAQLARAIGIHLILATQRPSVNVITGIIKANFPARISFRVTSKVDSRTILDSGGADQLIGRGDMLLSTGSDLVRIQNAFIDTPEVDKLVDYIADQRGYPDAYYLPEVPMESGDDDPKDTDLSDRDSMFDQAARLVVQTQQGSTSLIQRKLKLGYNRAGRIIDQLEAAGIVGPFSGSKARDVLVPDEYHLEQILNELG